MAGIGEPTIEELHERILAGMVYFGDPFRSHAGWTEENEIGRLWSRFETYLKTRPAWVRSCRPGVRYELHVVHPETSSSGEFEVFVGLELMESSDSPPGSLSLAALPIDVSVKRIPPGRYAIFTFAGADMATDMQMAVANWLMEHGHRRDMPFDVLAYDERFKGLESLDESTIEVYVPLLEA